MAKPKAASLRDNSAWHRARGNAVGLGGRRLGKLVPFKKRVRTGKARKAGPVLGNGKVLLFTGVRYQRDDVSLPDKPPASAPRPKRRRG